MGTPSGFETGPQPHRLQAETKIWGSMAWNPVALEASATKSLGGEVCEAQLKVTNSEWFHGGKPVSRQKAEVLTSKQNAPKKCNSPKIQSNLT